MSKDHQSKLDPFAERLEEWFFVQNRTFEDVQKELLADGLSVSQSRLCNWRSARADKRRDEHVLKMIASGSRQAQAMEKEFAANPAPGMDTIINLHRVLVMQLASQEKPEPKLLALADQLTRTAMEFISGQTKAKLEFGRLALAKDKFQFDAAKAAMAQLPGLRKIAADNALNETDKLTRARQLLFGELPPN